MAVNHLGKHLAQSASVPLDPYCANAQLRLGSLPLVAGGLVINQ